MIADLIRLSALYVLTRVFVEITMPSSKHIVRYLFYAGIALTVVGTMGPHITQATTDLHSIATTYTNGRNTINDIVGSGESPNPSVGYQGILERVLGNAKFDRPLSGKVTQEYKGEDHHGIDIAGKAGDLIKTSRQGKVKKIGVMDAYGLAVIVDHGNGWETLYGHCSKVVVKEGDMMLGSDKIAEVGSSGNSSGPHLHFEIRIGRKTVDPEDYLR